MKYKIRDLCDTISATFDKTKEKVVLINTSDVLEGNVLNHELVINENIKGQFKKTFQTNDILYSEIRPKNKRFAFVDFESEDYVASTKLMVLRANKKILPEFLFQLLKSDLIIQQLQDLAETRSGTFPQITFYELGQIDVDIPDINEQKIISEYIMNYDEKIENNKKINHHLEQIAHSIFKSWFVDFNPFGGDVPASWNEELLFDLATVTYGKNLPTKKLLSSGYRVFGGNGQIGYYSEYLYKKERILISCRGAASGTVRLSRPYSFVTNNSLIVNEKEPELFAYLKEWSLNRQFFDAVTGSAQPQVTVDSLKLISLPKPDKETLEKFTNLLMPIYNEIEANTTECEKLVILRDTLLPKLMTGKISVTD